MRYPTLREVLDLHKRLLQQSGGMAGVRDLAGLQSALQQPRVTFGGQDLYPDLPAKAAALGFSLIANHPFVDGNKRIGHAALVVFLLWDDYDIVATLDDQEVIILAVAAGQLDRAGFTGWLTDHVAAQGSSGRE